MAGWLGNELNDGEADSVRPLSLARWSALCAGAEAIGLTAAATAAKLSQAWVGDPPTNSGRWLGLSLVVTGGLIEGVALGTLQAAGLSRLLPSLNRRRWVAVTTAVAGVGWAAASAPAALAGNATDADTSPPILLTIGGAAGLGVVMGAMLGAAQASVLRGQVSRPARWVGANVAGWAPAMAVIFLGATAPQSDWPVISVAALGTLTGSVAGTVLGVVTGAFLSTLDARPTANRQPSRGQSRQPITVAVNPRRPKANEGDPRRLKATARHAPAGRRSHRR